MGGMLIFILALPGDLNDIITFFHKKKAQVELTTRVSYDPTGTVCTFDVVLLNSGDKAAIIDKISVEATGAVRTGNVPLDPSGTILTRSGSYDLDIGQLHNKGTKIFLNIPPHELPPNGADLLAVQLAALSIPEGTFMEAPLQMSFYAGDKEVHTENIHVKLKAYLE